MGKKNLKPEYRARALTLMEEGHSSASVAKRFDVHYTTINRLVKHSQERGYIEHNTSTGRPASLTDRDKRRVVHEVISGKTPTAAQVHRRDYKHVSITTVYKALHEVGYTGHMRISKPLLTPVHKQKRLGWARQHQWSDEEWSKVIFSDEFKFNLVNSDGRSWCWRRPNEELKDQHIKKTVKFGGGSVMVWGAISVYGLSELIVCDSRVDSEKYMQILQQGLIPFMEEIKDWDDGFILQQDGAPCHTSKRSLAWLDENNVDVLPWIPQSADMNPIEHCWAYLEAKLRQRPLLPTNLTQLTAALHEEWAKIPASYITALYESMPRRIDAVIKVKGGYTKY